MDFKFSAEDEAFRQEVRAFVRANLPPELKRAAYSSIQHLGREHMLGWTRILHKKGWSAPHWPKAYGGTGWTPLQQHIFLQECYDADAPNEHFQTFLLVGPTVIAFGSEAQKQKFLPPILRGEVIWSQGFSEPNAGSDLASLRTTAVRRGDKYVMNGTKIWTSNSNMADWCFFLVRTNPDVKPQQGISFLLADLRSPGITIRPIRSIDGHEHLCQVFLDNVEVPAENLVGEEGKGWTYAKDLLENERTSSAFLYQSRRELEKAREIARFEMKNGRPLTEDPEFSRRLARVQIELQALEYSVLRVLTDEKTRFHSIAVAAVLKAHGSELQQKVAELQLEALGPRALRLFPRDLQPANDTEAALWPGYSPGRTAGAMMSRASTIYGGSLQVQRGIIAKLAFGL
jgi:alkylation response protein AidB-like acyl-CoA dehydrogenase